MGDLTIATLCQALANITNNRCSFIEKLNTCRCFDDIMTQKPVTVINSAPNIMLSEVFLIFFVLALWLSAIGFCLNQYKSLRRLETQVHYNGNRKDPLNIGDIKIVAREQDSIIYHKKRYSTVMDTHINPDDLKAMQYVTEYLPKNVSTLAPPPPPPSSPSSIMTGLVIGREDLTANIPLSITSSIFNTTTSLPSTPYTPLTTHNEIAEDQQSPLESASSFTSFVLIETNANKSIGRTSFARLTESGQVKTGLTVPRLSATNSLRSSWNDTSIYDTSRSAQHLSVPSNSLRSTRFSDGNIAFGIPGSSQPTSENQDEQLLDPRLIPRTVRRSLLALHRQSHENINMQRTKEKTQSETDVHGSFTPWKIKMKSKLKRTHHHHQQNQPQQQQQQQQTREYSNTLSTLPTPDKSNEHGRRVSEYGTRKQEYRFSTPPLRYYSLSRHQSMRRSLKHYPKYSTQSTTESETTTQGETSMMMTNMYTSPNDNKSTKTIDEIDGESPSLTST
ncbi:unnamed protein product [Adineta steineri]|uniref:Uncharacterized protein n=1 Tax=Adineta steineri TaxID=433720 RepID=A0A813P807_9BILA|nr:unnamed protein product [Adineta steineri]CAF3476358.1 unnamed protein product [Adineta steineri]